MRPQDGIGDSIDRGRVRRVLEGQLGESVEKWLWRLSPYSSSFPIHEIDATLRSGKLMCLILKNLSRSAMLPQAFEAKPGFLYDGQREIHVYRDLIGSERDTARYYGSLSEDDGFRFLLLERVQGPLLYECGDLETWRAAAAWLGRFHQRSRDAPQAPDRLLRFTPEYCLQWAQRAKDRLLASSAEVRGSDRTGLERLFSRYDEVVDRLSALPQIFIHGEFYPSNVIVGRRQEGDLRICPVDWEMAARGPGLIDLAALLSGGWSEEERRSLLRAYLLELPEPDRPSQREFHLGLLSCRMQLAIQWLGWGAGWTPPAHQANDWLDEALTISAELLS